MCIKVRKVVTVKCEVIAETFESVLRSHTTIYEKREPHQWVVRDFGLLKETIDCYPKGLVTVTDDPTE